MPKKNIVIIGGGFAGVSALRVFSCLGPSARRAFQCILIDKKSNFEFLPMLPDVIAGWIKPPALSGNLRSIAAASRCVFEQAEVTGIDLIRRKVFSSKWVMDYEYLLICSGAEPDISGSSCQGASFLKLGTLADAVRIRAQVLARTRQSPEARIVIIGGGYTGVETASSISYLLQRERLKARIYIVEKEEDILAMMPEWIRADVRRNLEQRGVEMICREAFKAFDGNTVTLMSNRRIDRAVCVWTAGMRTAPFIGKMPVRLDQTRISVGKKLRLETGDDQVFAAGDAGYFFDRKGSGPLRMAVMFSIGQGKTAAANILRHISRRPLVEYHPVDLGYLVPMASGKASGVVLGRNVRGRTGFFLHYFMCIARSMWSKKPAVARDIFRRFIQR